MEGPVVSVGLRSLGGQGSDRQTHGTSRTCSAATEVMARAPTARVEKRMAMRWEGGVGRDGGRGEVAGLEGRRLVS